MAEQGHVIVGDMVVGNAAVATVVGVTVRVRQVVAVAPALRPAVRVAGGSGCRNEGIGLYTWGQLWVFSVLAYEVTQAGTINANAPLGCGALQLCQRNQTLRLVPVSRVQPSSNTGASMSNH